MTELEAAAKRLDQSEGGKSALVDQVCMEIVSLQVEKIINEPITQNLQLKIHSHHTVFTDIYF